MGAGRITPNEERIVLLKPVVQFSFTYGVSRGFFNRLFYALITSLLFIVSKLVCSGPYKTNAPECNIIKEIVRKWKNNGIVTESDFSK